MVKLFEEYNELPKIPELLKDRVDLNKFISNGDGTFTYDGKLNLAGLDLEELPDLKISKVTGDFNCSFNNLTSLQFVPEKVFGKFNCSNNKLVGLKGAPLEVIGIFNCSSNQLISLEFAPSKVGGDFNCSFNNLTSLQFLPSKIDGNFYCSDNELISDKHGSSIEGRYFISDNNPLTKTGEVVEAISKMTYEQQVKQLEFFGRIDSKAYKVMMEILEELGVEINQDRKDLFKDTQDKDNIGIW